jgi:hypothetical protein
MATSRTAQPARRTNGRAPGPDEWNLEPPAGASPKRRLPDVLVGLAVVVGCALAAVVWSASSAGGDAVLALVNPIARGQVVTLDDLKSVEVSTQEDVGLIPRTESGQVVGRRALAPLPAGALLSASQFATTPPVEPGEAVVGLALGQGEYPIGEMAPGDVMSVVLTPGQGGSDGEEGVLVAAAEIYAVASIGSQGEMFVSLLVAESDVTQVTSAAAGDRVRLVLVAGR